MTLDRRTDDTPVRERLTAIETGQTAIKDTVERIDKKLFGNGDGLVADVTRHKTYWKLVGRVLVILGTASAGALAASAIL